MGGSTNNGYMSSYCLILLITTCYDDGMHTTTVSKTFSFKYGGIG